MRGGLAVPSSLAATRGVVVVAVVAVVVLAVVPLVRRGVVCADGSLVSSLGGGCGSSLCGGGVSSVVTARAPVVVRRVCVRVCAVSWSFGNQGVDWWLRLAMPVPTVWCVCPLSLSCAPRSVCGGVRFALPVLLEGSPWRPDVLVVLSPCRVVPCGCVRPAGCRASPSHSDSLPCLGHEEW